MGVLSAIRRLWDSALADPKPRSMPPGTYTPEVIGSPTELPKGSVFVFGSNTDGHHGGGSAQTAFYFFGARIGQSEGRQGQSYGIVTTDFHRPGRFPLEYIERGINRFLAYARTRPCEVFWVTKIGTLAAGYTVSEIANLWADKSIPPNVMLPREFDVRGGDR